MAAEHSDQWRQRAALGNDGRSGSEWGRRQGDRSNGLPAAGEPATAAGGHRWGSSTAARRPAAHDRLGPIGRSLLSQKHDSAALAARRTRAWVDDPLATGAIAGHGRRDRAAAAIAETARRTTDGGAGRMGRSHDSGDLALLLMQILCIQKNICCITQFDASKKITESSKKSALQKASRNRTA
jgi:hypothetical protein